MAAPASNPAKKHTALETRRLGVFSFGSNVLLKGSSNIGTVTDIEGKYTLNIPKDATLIFKFVGYKTTEVAVNGKTTVNLSIQPDVKQLEDVVVIGYQAIKREKSTAAIASVAGEKIENIPDRKSVV